MVLIPLKDNNPLRRISFQYVTVFIIAACIAVFLWQLSLGEAGGRRAIYGCDKSGEEFEGVGTERTRRALGLGTIPSVLFSIKHLPPELAVIPAELTVFTSMFMHGGWMHLIGNMLFLWVLGDNIEDAVGHVRFVFFYLITGIAAVLTHAAMNPQSELPMIGASGGGRSRIPNSGRHRR